MDIILYKDRHGDMETPSWMYRIPFMNTWKSYHGYVTEILSWIMWNLMDYVESYYGYVELLSLCKCVKVIIDYLEILWRIMLKFYHGLCGNFIMDNEEILSWSIWIFYHGFGGNFIMDYRFVEILSWMHGNSIASS